MRVPKHRVSSLPLLYGLLLAVVQSTSGLALGQPTDDSENSGSSPQPARRIELTLVGDSAQFDPLEPLLPEWFRQDGLRVEVRRQATLSPEDVLAVTSQGCAVRIWVTVANFRQARAYFSDCTGKHYLVREVPLRNGLDEFGREQLVQVLVTSAEAFAADRASSSVVEVVRTFEKEASFGNSGANVTFAMRDWQATPMQVQVPSPEVHWSPRVGALLGASLEGAGIAQYGPGLLFGVRRTSTSSTYALTAKGQYLRVGDAAGEHVTIATKAVALRLTLATQFWENAQYQFGVELGGGVDHVTFTPSVKPGTGLSARAAGDDWRPVMVASLTCSTTYGNWRLALAAGLSTSLFRVHYDVLVGNQQDREVVPWLVQPGAAIEASWQ